jgi:large subunit ribosomal protein L6
MFAPARRRCAQCVARASQVPTETTSSSQSPAFARSSASRNFTTTSPCQSKVGSEPLSVPQGVTFSIIPPSTKGKGTRVQAMSTVQIKGPLAELSMEIPNYVNINQDPKLSGPTLTIRDSTDAKQKAMWGTSLRHPLNHALNLTMDRYNPRISPEPHPRRQRRPQRNSPLRRCRLPCLG